MGEAQLEIRGYPGNIPAMDPVRVIHNLWVPTEARRKGEARWLLANVTVEADRHAAVLLVQPVPYGDPPGIDVEALERFYRQFGFRMIEGTEADPTMVREPRAWLPLCDIAPSAAQSRRAAKGAR